MKRTLFILASLLMVVAVFAQTTVSGRVTDAQGEALIGVSVMVEGTTSGTITDFDGNYQIDAPQNGVLVFSYVGYQTETVKIQSSRLINVTLKEDNKLLDEVVVVGYDTQRCD